VSAPAGGSGVPKVRSAQNGGIEDAGGSPGQEHTLSQGVTNIRVVKGPDKKAAPPKNIKKAALSYGAKLELRAQKLLKNSYPKIVPHRKIRKSPPARRRQVAFILAHGRENAHVAAAPRKKVEQETLGPSQSSWLQGGKLCTESMERELE